ncbi:MAG: glycosyltransferase family 4 protein [Porphyromonadaceae bacterium]|nr:glycosyltransferase family 4 protein [Porphyromonadaceae bacterium]
MRKVLVDLSALKNVYSGFGQVALTYGRYFQNNYRKESAHYSLTLLVPDDMIGKFGNEVNYLSSSNRLKRRFPFLFPKFDVWHSTHQLSKFRPFYSGTKQILTFHDLNYLYERKGFSRYRKHRQLQGKINRADQLVCISHFTKEEIERNLNLNRKKCNVIYNYVEPFDECLASKPSIDIKMPFFFSIGALRKKKNFHVLLDLMKLYPEKHLYIAGTEVRNKKKNAYALMIKERIKNERITNVTLLGGILHEEKIWMYKNCEAFLFPSLFEGFGLPVIEAMQFGKPVFSSAETSLKEIGGQFAYFWDDFEPYHMKSLIDANLERFYNERERVWKEKQYAESFSTNTHFEEYEKLYEHV